METPLFASILDQLKQVVDYDSVTVFELEGRDLTALLYRGPAREAESYRWSVSLDLLEKYGGFELRAPVIIPDLRGPTSEARPVQKTHQGQLDTIFKHEQSSMTIPVLRDGRLVGVVVVAHREPGHYTRRHAESACDFVSQVAGDIEDAMLYAQAVRRADELQALLSIQQAITSDLNLDAVLQMIVREARRLAGTRWAIVYLRHGDCLRPAAMAGDEDAVSGGLWSPATTSSAGKPLENWALDLLNDRQVCTESGCQKLAENVMRVPLYSGERLLGALVLVDKLLGTFGAGDEWVLQALAPAAVIGLENARMYAQAEEMSRLQERQRIAQALHDTIAQMLFAIGLEVERTLGRLSLPELARLSLQTIGRLAERSSHELRNAIFALRKPEPSAENDLLELLQERVHEFQAECGVAATLIAPSRLVALPPSVNEAAYRVVSEALANIRKHAQASTVVVSVHRDAGWVTLTVQDDGTGLTDPAVLEGDERDLRFGVANMRELVEQAKGLFFIGNNDDRGVTVRARFPVAGEGGS